MVVTHAQSGEKVRLSSSHKLFGQERETIDEAFAGDIVGLVGHSSFGIGDTLTEDGSVSYDEIPRFPPECFAHLHNPNPSKFKQFRKGVDQLLQGRRGAGFPLEGFRAADTAAGGGRPPPV